MDEKRIAAVLEDYRSAPIDDDVRAALRLLEAMTKDPLLIDEAFVDKLRQSGLDNKRIEGAASVSFRFNQLNRAADALDFPILEGEHEAKAVKILDRMSRLFASTPPTPSYSRGDDGIARPIELTASRAHFLSAPAATSPALRVAAEALGALSLGASRPQHQVPDELIPYLEKVAMNAYKVIDDDFDAMRTAGYDDAALFEITFACSLGAACAGVEALYERLYPA